MVDKVQTNPYFSICIPVYNVKYYLTECLESVLAQSEKDFEIILVDDGSDDGSGLLCDEYAQKYNMIKVIHKENEGLFLARYDAVRESEGKYLLFLDSDDKFSFDILKRIRERIEKYTPDMIIFDYYRFSDNGLRRDETRTYAPDEIFEGSDKTKLYIDLVVGEKINSIWSKCIRRGLYDLSVNRNRYIGLNMGEDKLASLYLLDRASRILYFKEPLYAYRFNSVSITSNKTLKQYKDLQIVYYQVAQFVKKWGLPDQLKPKWMKPIVTCGIGVVTFIEDGIKNGSQNYASFKFAVDYISNDSKFGEAVKTSSSEMKIYERVVSRLIVNKHYRELRFILRFITHLRMILYIFAGKRKANLHHETN